MADLIFPPSPATGDEFTGTFGEVYTYDGEKWTLTADGGGGSVDPASLISTDANNIITTGSDDLLYAAAPSGPVDLTGTPVAISLVIPGKPPAGQYYPIVMAFPVNVDFGDSRNHGMNIGTAATANAVFQTGIQMGAAFVNIGNFTVATNDTVTFTGSASPIQAGQALMVQAPATQDATLQGVSVTFYATRA